MDIKKALVRICFAIILCLGTLSFLAPPVAAAGVLIDVRDTLSDNLSGHTAVHNVTFTLATELPKNGKFFIQFPGGFNLSGVRLGSVPYTFSLSLDGQILTLTKTGNQTVPAGTSLNLPLQNIINTTETGASYYVTVWTTSPGGSIIDGPTRSANFAILSVDAVALRVAGYPTTTDVGLAHNFNVTALDSSGVAMTNYSGTVHFSSSDPLATLPINYTFLPGDGGDHTFSATFNTTGTHSITVADVSNSGINGTQSDISVNSVEAAETTTTVESSNSSLVYGNPVTFTAAVSGPAGTPTGTVTFFSGATELGMAALVSGQAAYTSAAGQLTASSHNITAHYDGDSLNNPSVSPALTQVVSKRPLTISAVGINRSYNGSTSATVTLSSNKIAADEVIPAYTSASFTDKNVGVNKPVSVSGISAGGADAGNYSWNTTASTTANITSRTLTVTAAGVTKTYDGTTAASVTLSDNRAVGDSLTLAYTSAVFTDKNAGTRKTVNVSGISAGGVDAVNYTWNTTASTTADISKAKPVITWARPADISYPTPLGSAQLNATASIPGQFVYSPAAGTILNPGNNQTLQVNFSPQDATNYATVSASVSLNVLGSGWKIVFTTARQNILPGNVSNLVSLQVQNSSGNPANVVNTTLINLNSSSGTGRFDTSADGAFNGSITSVSIPAGTNSAGFYYKDSAVGSPFITATGAGFISGSQQVTVRAETTGGGSGGSGGGGGGGGGGSTTPSTIEINGLTSEGLLTVDRAGIVKSEVQLETTDNRITLRIPAGTKLLDAAKKPLKTIQSSVVIDSVMKIPDGALILACEFGPEGAIFSPPLVLTMSYDPAALPEIVPEKSLHIALWDGSVWVPLESIVDTGSYTVTVQINHFSVYALAGDVVQAAPLPETTPEPAPAGNTGEAETPGPATSQTPLPIATATFTPALQEAIPPVEVAAPVSSPDISPAPVSPMGNGGLSTPVLLFIYISIFLGIAIFTVVFIFRRSRTG